MKKRLFSTLLALCMVLVLLPGAARAAGELQTEGNCGENLTWKYEPKFDEFGYQKVGATLTISGNGAIPDSVYAPWRNYDYYRYISKVIIEDGVTSIGSNSFSGFIELTDLTIKGYLTTIGYGAFTHCTNLDGIIIPNSVTVIGSDAFRDCTSLTSITVPGTVNAITSNMFSGCSNLSEVTIQNGVQYIEDRAFYGCGKLTQISIPASVIRVETGFFGAFSGCSDLTEITVAPQNTEYSSQDGALFTKEKDRLLFCPQGKTT